MRTPALLVACLMAATLPAVPEKVEMAGYLLVPTERVPERYERRLLDLRRRLALA
jgi:hypothetical protein